MSLIGRDLTGPLPLSRRAEVACMEGCVRFAVLKIRDALGGETLELTGQADSLTIEDHTFLVQAVLDRPLHVMRYLELPKREVPTPEQVLDAALKVRSFDAETKSRLRRVRDLFPVVEAGKAQLPRTFLDEMERLSAEVTGKPVGEKLSIIARAREAQANDYLLATGLEIGEQILRDGADSIYAADFPAAELLENPTFDTVEDIAAIDVITGSIGAGVGALAGGVGAVPAGAVAAGAGSLGAGIAAIVIAVFR